MEEAIESPKEPRALARLLADSFEAFIGTLPVSVVAWTVSLVPSFAAMLLLTGMLGGPPDKDHLRAAALAGNYAPTALLLGAGLLQAALNVLALGAVVLAVDAFQRRTPLRIGEALAASTGVWFSLVWTQILAGFWVLLGFICLIVPGVLLALRYALVHLAVILEGRTGNAALARSKELMIRHMGRILGSLFVVVLVAIIMTGFGYLVMKIVTFPLPATPEADVVRQYLLSLPGKIIGTWPIAALVLLFRDVAAEPPAAGPPAVEPGAPGAPAAI